jgi:hypothetical protein
VSAAQPQPSRGAALLFEHCVALSRLGEPQAPAVDRLERLLGGELTRFLIAALAGGAGAARVGLLPV